MKINTIGELEVLAQKDRAVCNILTDFNIGRKNAVSALALLNDVYVSEKLVRTFRGNLSTAYDSIKETVQATRHLTLVPEFSEERKTTFTSYTKGSNQSKKIFGFGDFQINKHDRDFLARIVQLIADEKPDMICLTGDESDNSAVGRHAKGLKEEFESNLQDQIDETISWFAAIRDAAPNAEIHMAHSNHMEWITRAIHTRLPGLATLRVLTPEILYQLNDFDIQYQRKIYEFVPGYVLAHGHQWSFTSGSHATQGAQAVRRLGKSLLAGHCHQGILKPVYIGYEGKGEQLVYANPGCVMDFEKAMESNGGYISGTSPDWSKGIIAITHDQGLNYTELIMGNNDGSFKYGDKIYR